MSPGEADGPKSEGDATPSDSTKSFWLCKGEACRHMNPVGTDRCQKCFKERWSEFKSK